MRSNYAAISDKLASYEKKEADEAKNALLSQMIIKEFMNQKNSRI